MNMRVSRCFKVASFLLGAVKESKEQTQRPMYGNEWK